MSVQACSSAFGVTTKYGNYVNTHEYTDGPTGIKTTSVTGSGIYMSHFNSKTGVKGNHKDPTDYYRAISSETANEPIHYRTVERYSNGNLYAQNDYKKSLVTDVGDPGSWVSGWTSVFENKMASAFAEAKTKALGRLKDNDKFQLGVAIVEGRKTSRMVADNTVSIFKAIRQWKQGNGVIWLRDLARDRDLAKKWLEFIYGWVPTLSDIHEGTKRLSAGITEEKYVFSVQATVHVNELVEWDYMHYHIVEACNGLATCRIEASIKNPYLEYVGTLDLMNPTEIVWELVPYSFIVDWFIPVGNVLSALTASAGLDWVSGYTTVLKERDALVYANTYPGYMPAYMTELVSPGKLAASQLVMSRAVLHDFPSPELYNKKNPFSGPHITAAIALIAANA